MSLLASKSSQNSPENWKMIIGILSAIVIIAGVASIYGYFGHDTKETDGSHPMTEEERLAITGEFIPVGTGVEVKVPQFETVAATVIENNGGYSLKIIKYGDMWPVPDANFDLKLKLADGSSTTIKSNLFEEIHKTFAGQKNLLPSEKKIVGWNIEFTS